MNSFIATVFACASIGVAQPAEFRLLDPHPGKTWSVAFGVSDDGRVIVGSSKTPESNTLPVLWTATGVESLAGAPPGFQSGAANGVSADGRVIVGRVLLEEELVGFAWTEAEGYRLLRGESSEIIAVADGVSGDGRVACGVTSGPFQGTVWDLSTGAFERVGSLLGASGSSTFWALDGDGDTGVGASYSPQGIQAYLWRRGKGLEPLGDLPGGFFESGVNGITRDGRVAVGNGYGPHGLEPMRWTAATGMVGLGGRGFASGARDVSDDGWRIVGGGAFIWDPIRGAQSLPKLLQEEYGIDLQGWRLANVNDITPDGTMMVGLAIDDATEVRSGYFVRLPPFCYADCDDSTGRGVLDIHDFLEFQRRFALQDLYSDCDQNGVHDFFDFLCFQNHFVSGCD